MLRLAFLLFTVPSLATTMGEHIHREILGFVSPGSYTGVNTRGETCKVTVETRDSFGTKYLTLTVDDPDADDEISLGISEKLRYVWTKRNDSISVTQIEGEGDEANGPYDVVTKVEILKIGSQYTAQASYELVTPDLDFLVSEDASCTW